MPSKNLQHLPHTGKLIAFDVGSKTLGIAVCDKSQQIANPRTTLPRTVWKADAEKLQAMLTAENIVGIVVGLPLTLAGTFSPTTDAAHSFADLAETTFGLPVVLWDERFSTQAAENALFEQRQGRQTRASRKQVKQQVDSVAAALVLQNVLDARRLRS